MFTNFDDFEAQAIGSQSAFSSHSAHISFQLFLDRAVQEEEVWLLQDHDGFVQLALDEGACFPVWSNYEAACQWLSGEWEDCRPVAVDVIDWMQHWLPNMVKQMTVVSVDPKPELESFVVDAEDLLQSLHSSMAEFFQPEIEIKL